MNRFLRCAVVLLFGTWLGAAAHAESAGRLLFVNTNTGKCAIGGIDEAGQLNTTAFPTCGATGQFLLASTPSGVISYRPLTGASTIFRLGAANDVVFRTQAFSSGWQTLVALGNYVLFYDDFHTGAVVAFNPDGSVKQTDSSTAFSQWTSVVATQNYLFYYNYNSGVLAVQSILYNGTLFAIGSSTLPKNYTVISSIGDVVFLYNRTSGFWETLAVKFEGGSGANLVVAGGDYIAKGFGTVVHTGNHLLLYNIQTGAGLIGTLRLPGPGLTSPGTWGSFKSTQTVAFSSGWDHIVPAGKFLFFYNSTSGVAAVGLVSDTGTFIQTQTAQLDKGWTGVAASRQ